MPGDHAADQQLADADVGDDPVEDQRDARRDQHRERARDRDDAAGELRVVALLEHRRHRRRRQRRRRRGARARDRAEAGAGERGRHARPPGTRPTQVDAALNRSSATPLRITNSAIRMNIGTEISSYEPAVDSGVVVITPASVAGRRRDTGRRCRRPRARTPTGMPSASSTNSSDDDAGRRSLRQLLGARDRRQGRSSRGPATSVAT